MLHFIDFEVIQSGDWLCCIYDYLNRKMTDIVNDIDALTEYYELHKKDLFVGYNIRNYDQFIFKSILLGMNPVSVNNKIIVDGLKGWEISSAFRNVELNFFDAQYSKAHSLKQLEGFQGHDIRESSVDFMKKEKLTDSELEDLLYYCRNDVLETVNVFFKKIEEFDAYISLIKTFNLGAADFTKTKAQLSSKILDCKYTKRDDAFDIKYVDNISIKNYKSCIDFFRHNKDYSTKLDISIAGVDHVLGWGGIHGARLKYHAKSDDDYIILHVDGMSYYPTLMIQHHLLSRSVLNFDYYKEIYDTRIRLKHQGKKKEQGPYKIILNGTFGICKDKTNAAFDECMANSVCINGQLLLVDLIEKMESIDSFELIQSNTDGLIIKILRKDFDKLKKICDAWESRSKVVLEYDYIDEIWQKDVNNYVFRFTGSDKIERKGAYVKKCDDLDNDLAVVSDAVVEYMLYGTSVEDYIYNENDLIRFQKIFKVSSKYKSAWHNDKFLDNRINRVFASRVQSDSHIGKCKTYDSTIEKFANTPEHCFIDNGDIVGKKCPVKLDKDFYVDMAKSRLKDFGLVA